jgi:hypothetical protein
MIIGNWAIIVPRPDLSIGYWSYFFLRAGISTRVDSTCPEPVPYQYLVPSNSSAAGPVHEPSTVNARCQPEATGP